MAARDSATMRHEIVAPTDCTIVEIRSEPGDSVPSGVTIAIVEMMKIERLVEAPADGVITEVRVSAGEVVKAGQTLAILEEQSIAATLTADDPDDGAAG
ncbi:MAG: acetyl-CoA carboxylase biotin carboxyl carrier protein subunit, partial [Actinobacteria bacterium]|nr:acetyl-CoA carboxylase biotin carboxyl carrier protein subunit [Actinomycetota bacterium]